jgi:serine/threonine-protein kinase
MQLYCTRPDCPRPVNQFTDLDDSATLRATQQKFCTACGMPLFLAGRYLTQSLLGRGGFGAAFLARDRYTPGMRQCVVKQFQPAGDLPPNLLKTAHELFEREGQVLEQLGSHPQIPDLLAFFDLDVPSRVPDKPDRFFYLVQEYIDGQNLEQELAQKGPFSEKGVLEVLIAVLKVLKFVHENGSIHRDIKPSNIMRHRDGRIYLLDFGAVKQATASAPLPRAGRASTGIYSIGFAPPEQVSGNVVYPATDLYALAVTCLMLLTGRDPSELYDNYTNRWNWSKFTQTSPWLQEIFNRMLLPTPSDRFQSADEVLVALRAGISSPSPAPVSTPAPPVYPPTVQFSPPPPPVASASAAPAPASVPAPPPVRSTSPPAPARPPFSTLEILAGAAFAGFEGGLLAIALASLIGTVINPVYWVGLLSVVGLMVFAQSRRWIERFDLVIIAGITLALVLFVPGLHQSVVRLTGIGASIQGILFIAIFVALIALAVTTLFRLIYNLLSRML